MPSPSGLSPAPSSRNVSVVRASAGGLAAFEDALATEEPLEIRVSYARKGGIRVTKSISVTMRTPGFDQELAAGFLFTEGILRRAKDVESIESVPPDGGGPGGANVVQVTLRDGVGVDVGSLERHFYTTSSCGVCGKTSIEALRMGGATDVSLSDLVVDLHSILRMPELLRKAQGVFNRTGGLHAAGLFDEAGAAICVREDVGRHNAVDKVIGAQFMEGRMPLGRSVLFLSGRASFELVQKALMAGVPVLVSVGAPSTLAVDTARKFGATLMGFAREGRVNLYSGAHRLREVGAPATA